jgi:hypothetical protein
MSLGNGTLTIWEISLHWKIERLQLLLHPFLLERVPASETGTASSSATGLHLQASVAALLVGTAIELGALP